MDSAMPGTPLVFSYLEKAQRLRMASCLHPKRQSLSRENPMCTPDGRWAASWAVALSRFRKRVRRLFQLLGHRDSLERVPRLAE